jgi:hypothetical protein
MVAALQQSGKPSISVIQRRKSASQITLLGLFDQAMTVTFEIHTIFSEHQRFIRSEFPLLKSKWRF